MIRVYPLKTLNMTNESRDADIDKALAEHPKKAKHFASLRLRRDGMGYEEIGKLLDLTGAAAYQKIKRAERILRDASKPSPYAWMVGFPEDSKPKKSPSGKSTASRIGKSLMYEGISDIDAVRAHLESVREGAPRLYDLGKTSYAMLETWIYGKPLPPRDTKRKQHWKELLVALSEIADDNKQLSIGSDGSWRLNSCSEAASVPDSAYHGDDFESLYSRLGIS
ncbi:MAG: hypothetical protein ACI9UN_002461 [Granulosicoccus sp.]|jgi:hypothetical protein